VDWLGRSADLAVDPDGPPPVRSSDPDDDYLIALAAAERALLVSGDVHLTSLANRVPVRTPAEFLSETPGVVEHGLFPPQLVWTVLVGRGTSVDRIDVSGGAPA